MFEENALSGARAPAELLAAQNLILEMIALGNPIEDVLREIAAFIDRLEPAGSCCVHLLEPDGRTLRLTVTSNLPQSFAAAAAGRVIGGACGAATFRRRRLIVADVATDPLYEDFRDHLFKHGIRSAWATPILSSEGAALGAVGVYYTKRHVPQQLEIEIVERAVYLARIAIERRRFEQRLQASQDHFRALIESTSDIIAALDGNGVIRYLSPSVERILGYDPGELLGSVWFDLIHPGDRDTAWRSFRRMLEWPGAAPLVKRRVLHKDGSGLVFEIVCNNQLTEPAIAGVVVTARDVTEREAAADELISSQNRYIELFENANDIIYTHDLAGKLTSLNKAGEALTGYRREEALGMNISDFLAPGYKDTIREMTARKVGGESKTDYQLEILSKQGTRAVLDVSSRLIFQNGKPVGVQGIARDVTERRRLEAHLQQSQKMEAIGRLAGGVAHDFNNLLTVITGYGQWMLEEIPSDSPLTHSAVEILFAANRAAALTNQLLAFSRNQLIQPILVDLNTLVSHLDNMLRRLIGEDVELILDAAPDLGLIRADPSQIEQVVLNLAVNARDAMPEGGKLTIETANVSIGEDLTPGFPDLTPGDYVVLTVGDSGCGIDDFIKPYIFEPFFTTKEIGKGTGLGLSTVYGIVKQGGGHIRVDSEVGAGSVFRVYFNRVEGVLAEPRVSRQAAPIGGKETILLVEDDAPLRRMAADLLSRLGYTVLETADPRLAREVVAKYDKPIDLLLTDVVMPHLSGRTVARQLKEVAGNLKILFMSGYLDEPKLKEDLVQPGAGYLQKPFTPDQLALKVRELLDG